MNGAQAPRREEPRDLFAAELAHLESSLDVPYPDRAQLIDEVAADLTHAYEEERAKGVAPRDARAAALSKLGLDPAAVQAIESVHAPPVVRLLRVLPPLGRSWVRAIGTAAPLAALFLFLVLEVPVNHFLREGGGLVFFIVAFGALGLILELQRFFVWFVIRDHSDEALRRNTPTPLYLAAATVLLGVLGTASKYYFFLARWGGDTASLRRGLREPLASMILACCLAALTVLVHSALCVGLRAIRVPEEERRQ